MRQKPVVDTNLYCIKAYHDGKYLRTSFGALKPNTELSWGVKLEKAELFDRESALSQIRQLPACSVRGIVVERILRLEDAPLK